MFTVTRAAVDDTSERGAGDVGGCGEGALAGWMTPAASITDPHSCVKRFIQSSKNYTQPTD